MRINEKLAALDAWLLNEKVQKCSDKIHDRLGLSCFRQAQICGAMATTVLFWVANVAPDRLGNRLFSVLAVCSGALTMIYEYAEQTIGKKNSTRTANWITTDTAYIRQWTIPAMVVTTFLSALNKAIGLPAFPGLFSGLSISGEWLMVAMMYLASCTPPPKKPMLEKKGLAPSSVT